MKKLFRLLLFGVLSWLVTFAASVCLFALKKKDEHLFEVLMGFMLTSCTVGFTILYFCKINTHFLREGVLFAAAFLACNILCDLPMLSFGPMQMPLTRYFKEIGIAYLSMPIVAVGVGYILKRAQNNVCRQ